jgi:hypothetical protein
MKHKVLTSCMLLLALALTLLVGIAIQRQSAQASPSRFTLTIIWWRYHLAAIRDRLTSLLQGSCQGKH